MCAITCTASPTGQYEQLIAKGYPEWLAKLIYEAGEAGKK